MSTDRNYANVKQNGVNSEAERVGDITGQPPVNEPIDRNKAARMANLLEGLKFPATKNEIRDYLIKKSPSVGNRLNEVLAAVENNLKSDAEYDSVYDIEREAGFVEKVNEEKNPYVRDRALNVANKKRIDKENRQDLYTGREKIWPANERNVSPNTPEGEEV